jgi:hypothetical protein
MANTPTGVPVLPEVDAPGKGAPKYPQLVQIVRRLEADVTDLATRLEAVESRPEPVALAAVIDLPPSGYVCDTCGTTLEDAHFEVGDPPVLCPNATVEKTAA